ncbi:MAG: DUF5677 domain-containing protein, partial [Gammaproteobacteria bacterium]|nr:DUF5677 domain-containing protein [Gammaproteobacteria bacterium]
RKVYHKAHRDILKRKIKDINKLKLDNTDRLTIAGYDEFLTFIDDECNKDVKTNSTELIEEISLAQLFAVSLGLLTMSFNSEESSENLLPLDWISDSLTPNPNFVIQALLSQITTYSQSIIKLCQNGFDNPARALVRVTIELIQQTLVLTANKHDLRSYVNAHEDHEASMVWHKLFGKGKLDKKLTEIEKELGLTDDLINSTKTARQGAHTFYSQNIHHSFTASCVGSRAWSFDDDSSRISLFGGASTSLRVPLNELNTNLWYFNTVFLSILKKIHGIKLSNPEKGFWLPYFAVRDAASEIYISGSLQKHGRLG